MFNKRFGDDETVEINKNDLDRLHVIAAAGGAVLEQSISREAAILLLAQLGIGKQETLAVLDRTGKLIGIILPAKMDDPKAIKEAKFFQEIEDIVNIAYGKKKE